MIIRPAKKEDCSAAAKIHFQEIKYGFLNKLGRNFLSCFYETMTNSENAFLIVAEEKGAVIGFVSGCVDLKKFYREFISRHFFEGAIVFFRKILNFKEILETIRYSKKEQAGLPQAELLSIAVVSRFQGQGASQSLLKEFVSEMRRRGAPEFKVIVGDNLIRANKFYQKNGFEFHSRNFIHKDKPSNVYIYKIK